MDSRQTHTQARTHKLTQSQAKSLHISSHSLHSTKKRLKCHKCSCSHRGQWQLSKLLMLPSLLPVPYHPHFLFISLTLLTLSLFHPLSAPFFLPLSALLLTLFLSDLSFSPCPASAQCTSIIQRQSTGFFGLSNQSRALH